MQSGLLLGKKESADAEEGFVLKGCQRVVEIDGEVLCSIFVRWTNACAETSEKEHLDVSSNPKWQFQIFNFKWHFLYYFQNAVAPTDNLLFWEMQSVNVLFCSRLEPTLSDDDIWDLGCVLTQYILPMCREKSGLKTVRLRRFMRYTLLATSDLLTEVFKLTA